MIKNYFKIAFRNLWKNKSFSAINIIGLTIGMAAFILISAYVHFEESYDRILPDEACSTKAAN
jgi:putative ABC transport system permease protein